MKCGQCQSENEEDARFCENCGASLAPGKSYPPAAEPALSPDQIYCPDCGTANKSGSIFCNICGSTLLPEVTQCPTHPGSEQAAATKTKTSAAWWLMPVFLTWVGGLIAWLVVRQSDKTKARRLLWVGIGLTVFWFILNVVAFVVLYSMGYQFAFGS